MCLPGVHARPYTLVHANLVLWIPRAPSRTLLSSPPCVSCVSRDPPTYGKTVLSHNRHDFSHISRHFLPRSNISKSIRAIRVKILQFVHGYVFVPLSRNRGFQTRNFLKLHRTVHAVRRDKQH